MSRELSLASPASLRDGLYKLWRKFTAPNSTSAIKTGAHWVDNKPIYRKVIDMGSLASSGATTVAHGISGISEVVSLTGIANDLAAGAFVKALPIPNDVLPMTMGVANVVITSASDLTAYEQCYAVIEYTLL